LPVLPDDCIFEIFQHLSAKGKNFFFFFLISSFALQNRMKENRVEN
jgi:hypothetical protein